MTDLDGDEEAAQEECRPCCGQGPSPALSSRGQGVSQPPEPARLAGIPAGFAGPGPPFPPGRARSPRPAEPGALPGSSCQRQRPHPGSAAAPPAAAESAQYLLTSLSAGCVLRKKRRALVLFLPNYPFIKTAAAERGLK